MHFSHQCLLPSGLEFHNGFSLFFNVLFHFSVKEFQFSQVGFSWDFVSECVKVLSYGRKRPVVLEALVHDKDCALANILAAHFIHSSDPSKAKFFLEAAKCRLVTFHLFCLICFLRISFHT